MSRLLSALCLGLLLSGCYSMAIQPVPTQPVPDPPEGYRAAPLRFGRVLASLPRGTEIGGYVMSLTCAGPYGRVTWRKGPRFLGDEELVEAFNMALSDAGYEVAGDPEHVANLEDTNEELMRAEYVISARIRSLKINLCRETDLFMRQLGTSGEALMEVEWSIYSSVQRRQLKRITTKGYWKATEATDDGFERTMIEAFGAAASNLAAEQEFQNLIMEGPDIEQSASPPPAPEVIARFKPASLLHAPRSPAAAVAGAAVISTSLGHGSCFFIAPNLLITNTHVVGEAERVRIKPVYGRAVAGYDGAAGLNLFIPIQSALQRLGLETVSTTHEQSLLKSAPHDQEDLGIF